MVKKIGLVFADEMEFAPFETYAQSQKNYQEETYYNLPLCTFQMEREERVLELVGVQCGIGKVNAAFAATMLIAQMGAEIILNAGLSGAVANLCREDFVAGTTYIECDFDLSGIGYKKGEKPNQTYLYKADETLLNLALKSEGILARPLGTGDFFLADKVRKEEIYQTFGVDAFDMETGAIACVCDKMKVPFLSLRKISDDADESATSHYREMNERQETSLTQVLAHLFVRIFKEDSLW